LLLAVPGLARLAREPRTRPEAMVCVALPVLYVLVNAGLFDWHGGWSFGPRHLVAALPFLALGAAGVGWWLAGAATGLRRAVTAASVLLIAWSAFLILVGTSVKPEVARAVERPFGEFLFPSFFAGRLALNTQSVDMVTGRGHEYRYAWNVGERLGLDGRAQLLPLGLWAIALGGLWVRWAGDSDISTPDIRGAPEAGVSAEVR
jgi:hypothetical protein